MKRTVNNMTKWCKIDGKTEITEDDIGAYDIVLIEEPSKAAQRIANMFCKNPNGVYVKNTLKKTLIDVLGESIC